MDHRIFILLLSNALIILAIMEIPIMILRFSLFLFLGLWWFYIWWKITPNSRLEAQLERFGFL